MSYVRKFIICMSIEREKREDVWGSEIAQFEKES